MPIGFDNCEWGDFAWGDDPWDACLFQTPILANLIIYWDDDDSVERLGPKTCIRGERFPFGNSPAGHGLCWLLPEHMCVEDLDPCVGGTGDWHRLLSIVYDWLFGNDTITGFIDDIASFACIYDVDKAEEKYLDLLLLHLGFDLDIPLTENQKRKVIKLLVDLYRRKGTEPGIEEALLSLLGIPVEVFPKSGERLVDGFEAGEPTSTSLSDVDSSSDFVRISNIERFEIGETISFIDETAPHVTFEETEITSIVADRVYFDPQPLSGVIEAGAQVWCNRMCDQAATSTPSDHCSEIGPNVFDPNDPALYTFHVDIERTVKTVTLLQNGDTSVELSDVSFIVPGTVIRITDLVVPLQPPTLLTVIEVDEGTNTVTFDPVSLSEDIDIGADVLNVFTSEQLEVIRTVVNFAKSNHTHFFLTRDFSEALAEVI